MPASDPAIQLQHIFCHYTMGLATVRAVDDVSLSINQNEFPRPTWTFRLRKVHASESHGGLDRPTSGSIVANGQNIATLSPLDLARYRRNTIGMIFQSFNLLPRMTLEENIELPLQLAEVGRSKRPARVREALKRVRLTHRAGHRPAELSGGEQQRVAMLVNRPKILLADEPTDSPTGEAILALLREQTEPDTTIAMVTHELSLAEKVADRLAIMGDGKLLSTSLAKGLTQ
jgi:putative ABC transport system ATP-binding protein